MTTTSIKDETYGWEYRQGDLKSIYLKEKRSIRVKSLNLCRVSFFILNIYLFSMTDRMRDEVNYIHSYRESSLKKSAIYFE